jgi:hypothetical protein
MPRIIVTAEPLSRQRSHDAPILLDEQVHSVHLSSGHAASQLVERLAWAISDAEDAENALAARRAKRGRRVEHGASAAGSRARQAISA